MAGVERGPSFDSTEGRSEPKKQRIKPQFERPDRNGSHERRVQRSEDRGYSRETDGNNEPKSHSVKRSRWYIKNTPRSERGTPKSMMLPHTYETGDPYYIGDVYEESQVRLHFLRGPNTCDTTPTPYRDYIDALSDNGWPQLRYLADWMRVTTAPPKWKFLTKEDTHERATRVDITMLEFCTGLNRKFKINSTEHLMCLLCNLSSDKDVIARLFIVEDLSRDVIETLGVHLGVDPMFFRGFISDYSWYNTRDPWTEIPEMDIVSRTQSFLHARFAHTRYFRDRKSIGRARREAGGFNVLRRVDQNGNWIAGIDTPGSGVGTVRSKMSFWAQPQEHGHTGPFNAILLVDPSITEGFPLWGGYNNPIPCPPMGDDTLQSPAIGSTFEKVVYLLEQMSTEEVQSIAHDPRVLFHKPLCIVCSEWLVLIRYANTRLSQLEWEIEDPYLRLRYEDLSTTLDKIHAWRRRFPLYKALLREALNKVIRRQGFPGATMNSLSSLEKDFGALLSEVGDLHERAERIMSVVTAVMSIDESKKSLQQDRGIARLTYLAVTFVPLSFVSSFFSMTEDITKLRQTFWIYFTVAVPVTLIALIAVRFSGAIINFGRQIIPRRKTSLGTTRWSLWKTPAKYNDGVSEDAYRYLQVVPKEGR